MHEFTWTGVRHKHAGRVGRFGAASVLAVIVLALGVFLSGVVQAGHNFSDVPTGAFYHNAVEWVFNRGITAGCATGMYCPNDAVTRGTMAVFLRKQGQALTPTYLDVAESWGALDTSTNPVICQTADFSATGYPRTALLDGQVIINPGGAMGVTARNAVSFDGGVNWFQISGIRMRGSASASGYIFSISNHGQRDLNVGTLYRFGIMLSHYFGGADILNSDCEMHVAIVNRNGASSPLLPSR